MTLQLVTNASSPRNVRFFVFFTFLFCCLPAETVVLSSLEDGGCNCKPFLFCSVHREDLSKFVTGH